MSSIADRDGSGDEEWALPRASYGASDDRQTALRARHDPDDLLWMNQNIRPAA